ncbi:uncharacterized protein FOMMEDRAFT_167826 [Fomitiporia mediterranea MF3/22]|uniref:uncharacterized protein n=1 Tax=Fomitiporia mediterranea (strain MF3/22) TaxID=694068 RepID=UPI0004407F99|nr:uncharacterized protein FOMMEDRAFT_167826 [Fomitiporia mediterranea MF3/22]EJD02623.1 hypothetical protein FOMMEDRAFT_167826 [Fomitiporia mediterranea MF3/22]
MALHAKDYKTERGAYKGQQKVLIRHDHRKGKEHVYPKPWKTSKGYGTAAGRATHLGRNVGGKGDRLVWKSGPLALDFCDSESDFDCAYEANDEHESVFGDENEWYMRAAGDNDDKTFPELSESYDLQLAQAISLSLAEAATTISRSSDDNNFNINEFEAESLIDEADEFSFMGTCIDSDSDAMGADCEFDETGSAGLDETEWVEVDEFAVNERPTYAQMTKVEVT